MSLPIASLSLDLDNHWSYLKTHGDPAWRSYPSYLDVAVPRILAVLRSLGLRATVFVVGQDAALPKNHQALRALADAGYEIGNHSFHHEPWLHDYTDAQIEIEVALAEKHIRRATGQTPVGFRGPGYSSSEATLAVLSRRGYLYDASSLPTFLGPLARAYYFFGAKLTPEQKQQRSALFGRFRDGFRPLAPHWRQTAGDRRILEIPVTTMPVFRLPIHVSYLLYLMRFSRTAALAYFRGAMALCRLRHLEPSLLLHPLDFLGRDDVADLSFFPAMSRTAEEKLALVRRVLQMLSEHFCVVTMREHAELAACLLGETTGRRDRAGIRVARAARPCNAGDNA
jgi:hypothetical protein